MTTRIATCPCGQLRAICSGEPVRVSVCHCLECKKRSGSAFSCQARWADRDIDLTGNHQSWSRTGDSGNRATFHFCPTCGSTVAYTIEGMAGVTAIPVGAFADPTFPPPTFSVYAERKHDWVTVSGDGVGHIA